MALLPLIILAIVQGLTEFLPVSSSGHLVLARAVLGVELSNPLVLDVALHLGTLVAVVVVYRRDVVALIGAALGLPRRLLSGARLDASSRLLFALFIGSIPASIVGIGLGDWIEAHCAHVLPVGLALLATALLLGGADHGARRRGSARAIGYRLALVIGCAQAIAILPGCSRSGWTIAVAMLLGVEAQAGARFSFLLALPAIGGAALLQSLRLASGEVALELGWGQLAVAMAIAALTGYLACRTLLLVLRRGALRYFAYYCAAIGVAAVVIALV